MSIKAMFDDEQRCFNSFNTHTHIGKKRTLRASMCAVIHLNIGIASIILLLLLLLCVILLAFWGCCLLFRRVHSANHPSIHPSTYSCAEWHTNNNNNKWCWWWNASIESQAHHSGVINILVLVYIYIYANRNLFTHTLYTLIFIHLMWLKKTC